MSDDIGNFRKARANQRIEDPCVGCEGKKHFLSRIRISVTQRMTGVSRDDDGALAWVHSYFDISEQLIG